MAEERVVLLGCGDVGPIHEPMEAYSTLVRPILATADIRIGQCERLYTELGSPQVGSGNNHSRLKPSLASIFKDCGFDVVSMAGNHAMDWGGDALLDTMDLFQRQGIQTVGAGRNLAEARQPIVIERNGVRVAILAYCSVLREGYAAASNKPGIAPLRAHTYYQPTEYQPGMPPKVVTVPYEEDLLAMVDDVAAARKSAHAVVLSLHWGLHFIPRKIADYQITVTKAAFNAGADLILGHHAHVPKAIGVYGGKACFYSLGNFIMSSHKTPAQAAAYGKRYGVTMDPDYPNLTYGTDGKRTLIAKAVFTRKRAKTISFLPGLIDRQLRPEMLRRGDPRFDDAVAFMEWVSEDFNHKFVVEGDEVVVAGA